MAESVLPVHLYGSDFVERVPGSVVAAPGSPGSCPRPAAQDPVANVRVLVAVARLLAAVFLPGSVEQEPGVDFHGLSEAGNEPGFQPPG